MQKVTLKYLAIATLGVSLATNSQAQNTRFQRPATSANDLTRANVTPLTRPSISDILNKPDGEIVTGANGATMTVAQIRAQLNRPSEIAGGRVNLGAAKVPAVSDRARSAGQGVRPGYDIASQVSLARGNRLGLALRGCDETEPRLLRSSGELTPSGVVTIAGNCLGDARGELRMFGGFPGGVYTLPIHHWGQGSIVTQIPAGIAGVGVIPVRFEVITAARKITAPLPATFTPRMELVDVSNFWRGDCRPERHDSGRVSCGTNSMDRYYWKGTGYSPIGRAPIGSPSLYQWAITINSKCALYESWWNKGHGNITSFEGWDAGPPHESNVKLRAVYDKWLDVSFWGDTEYAALSYSLGANAHCPVGVSPQP